MDFLVFLLHTNFAADGPIDEIRFFDFIICARFMPTLGTLFWTRKDR